MSLFHTKSNLSFLQSTHTTWIRLHSHQSVWSPSLPSQFSMHGPMKPWKKMFIMQLAPVPKHYSMLRNLKARPCMMYHCIWIMQSMGLLWRLCMGATFQSYGEEHGLCYGKESASVHRSRMNLKPTNTHTKPNTNPKTQITHPLIHVRGELWGVHR